MLFVFIMAAVVIGTMVQIVEEVEVNRSNNDSAITTPRTTTIGLAGTTTNLMIHAVDNIITVI